MQSLVYLLNCLIDFLSGVQVNLQVRHLISWSMSRWPLLIVEIVRRVKCAHMPEAKTPVKMIQVDESLNDVYRKGQMWEMPSYLQLIRFIIMPGGPLFYIENNIIFHVGIVSYGVACASNQPSVNTRVTAYLDWIQQNTRSTTYCVRWTNKRKPSRRKSCVKTLTASNKENRRKFT